MADQTPTHRPKKPASEVLIKPPLSGRHRQSFILLHGRGSSARQFGPELLGTPVPGFGSLCTAFPCAKFIFPSAPKRRARIFKSTAIHQWFDYWSLETPERREGFQNDGLRETSKYIHELLRKEVEAVGASNVVLGGLSQGCAASLLALLLWEGEPLAAAVGMCGWLPYRKRIEEIAVEQNPNDTPGDTVAGNGVCQRISDDEDDEDEQDVIPPGRRRRKNNDAATATTTIVDTPPTTQAFRFLCEEIEFSRTEPLPARLSIQNIPVFLGHGTEDEKVPIHLGRSAATCLQAMEVDVHWEEYPSLGHWYSGDMLRDVVTFLREHAGWKVREENTDEVAGHRRDSKDAHHKVIPLGIFD